MKTISKEIQNLISSKGVLTGSQLFGVASKNSDYDFLVKHHEISLQDLIDNGFEYYLSDYNQLDFYSTYGKSSTGDIINALTFTSQLEYEAHVYATDIIMLLLKSKFLTLKIVSEKKTRVEIFEHFKSIYRIIHKKEI